ncbi:M16 family metallopeptidase [Pelagicoccus mobilis]|uniref:Insulinase family protein n=1 Tax=Pelagicoccus mobilis TaxID=415221 RepID=A0A934RV10_9BACT|nr:insulinase family protein [Pelagicoccus mobilis]MBK1878170.1 insulinase family protein [Pelagicoccus mobilis]
MPKKSVRALISFCSVFALAIPLIGKNVFDTPWPLLPQGVAPQEGEVWKELPNGLRYVIVPTEAPNGAVSMRLVVGAGRAQEPKGQAGVADVVSEMLLSGTEGYDEDEMLRFRLAAGMDPYSSYRADVEIDYTLYRVELEEPVEGALEQGIKMLGEFASAPGWDGARFERARKALANMAESSYSYFQGKQSIEERALLRSSVYSEIGDEEAAEGLGSVSLDDAAAYWSNWYKADRMVLVVAGLVETEAVDALIAATFSGLSSSDALEPLRSSDLRFRGTGDLATGDSPDSFGRVSIANVEEGIDLFDPASEVAFYRKDLISRYAMADLAANGLGKSAVDIVGDGVAINLYRQDNVMQAMEKLTTLDKTVFRLKEFGIPGEELEQAKALYLALCSSYDAELSTRAWPGVVADRLVRSTLDRLPFRYGESLGTFIEGVVEGLSVDATMEICEEVFSQKALSYYVELPKGFGIGTKSINKRLKGMRKSYDFTWEQAGEFDQQWNLGSGFDKTGMVESTEIIRIEEYPVLQYEFANNLRMNLVRTDEFPGDVRVMVSFGNGTTDAPGQGRAFEALVKSLVMKTRVGLGGQNPLLREVFDSKGIENLDAGVNLDRLYWSATADDESEVADFLSGIVIWMVTGNVLEDDFDDALEKLKEVTERGFDKSDSVVLQGLLYGEDERMLNFFTSEDLEGLDYAGMKNWVQKTREESYIEITVVGDVTPRTLIRDVRNSFGSAPDRKGKVHQPRHAEPAGWREAGVQEGTLKRSTGNGYVTLIFPQVEEKGCEADRRMEVLRPLLEVHLRRALEERPDWQGRLQVSLLGKGMVPRSNAVRVQLRCPAEELEEVKTTLLAAAASFSESLEPELVQAAERAAWIDLKRIPRSPDRLLKLFAQSQGKPNDLRCVLELLEKGISEDLETYKSVAAAQFAESNVRGAVAKPKG